MRCPRFDSLRVLILTLFVIGWALPAMAETESSKRQRTVLKTLVHVEVIEVQHVLELLDVEFAVKSDQNLVVVRGAQYDVENALKVLDALDSPRPTIELQIFVLAATQNGGQGVPESLRPATSQLQKVFGYKGFELLDSAILQVLEGHQGSIQGAIRLAKSEARSGYIFRFRKTVVVPGEGDDLRIRLHDVEFGVEGPQAGSSLRTDVLIREGQKAVIGSSTSEGVGNPLVLIVQAKTERGAH